MGATARALLGLGNGANRTNYEGANEMRVLWQALCFVAGYPRNQKY